MSDTLVLIESATASSDSAITLNPLDSTYDVYKVVLSNVIPETDNVKLRMRFAISTGDKTTSGYDYVHKIIKTYSTFGEDSAINQTSFALTEQELGTNTGEVGNAVIYLFNTQNSSEYSNYTIESVCLDDNGNMFGNQGGGWYTETEQHVAVSFYMASGNIASGEFKLYGIVK